VTALVEETGNGTNEFAVLTEISKGEQTWPAMTAKYGVENPLPPWKSSLDGLCDALDRSCGADDDLDFTFKQRRDEEDELSADRYAQLPYPENQLVSLAHSLLTRGLIDEADLRARLTSIRKRLEAE
jgi:hypothetical protein